MLKIWICVIFVYTHGFIYTLYIVIAHAITTVRKPASRRRERLLSSA